MCQYRGSTRCCATVRGRPGALVREPLFSKENQRPGGLAPPAPGPDGAVGLPDWALAIVTPPTSAAVASRLASVFIKTPPCCSSKLSGCGNAALRLPSRKGTLPRSLTSRQPAEYRIGKADTASITRVLQPISGPNVSSGSKARITAVQKSLLSLLALAEVTRGCTA